MRVIPLKYYNMVAIEKVSVEGWEPFSWDQVVGGIIITGGVPYVFKKGKQIGQKTFDGAKRIVVVVANVEAVAKADAYVAAKGICSVCDGLGEVPAQWRQETGITYKQCSPCQGSGKAKQSS